jgi:hypothetical protein
VCRLVRDDDCSYLVYSPIISIEDSSEPFQAFLGAILSVVKDVPVESSAYNPDIQLNTIKDRGAEPENDIDDGSGAYRGSLGVGAATGPPTTLRRCNGHGNTESDLMVHQFIDHLSNSSTFRLLRLLPNYLKTSKYGHISIPCQITSLPFRCALGTTNHTYGLPVLWHLDRLATSGNVILITVITCSLPRLLRCYAPLT